jgi:hypothetical protein
MSFEDRKFNAAQAASYHLANACRYFAMAWAADAKHWQDEGVAELTNAANAIGFDLVQREPAKLEAAE